MSFLSNAARVPGEEPEQVTTKQSPLLKDLPEKDDDWYKRPQILMDCERRSFSLIIGSHIYFSNGALAFRKDGRWISSIDPAVEATVVQEPEIEDSDHLGTFRLLSCAWKLEGVPVITEIKVYKKQPIVAFGYMFPEGLTGCSDEDRKKPAIVFPAFTNESTLGLVFAFTDENFSAPAAIFNACSGPLILYNENLDVVVIGPDRNFPESMIAPEMVDGIAGRRINCGLEGNLKEIPAEVWHETLIVLGNGIYDTLNVWGENVRMKYARQIQSFDADLAISHIGIWHDNGAHYYYNLEEYGDYEKTFLAIKQEAERLKIPFQYFHLDSWFYPKAPNKGGCLKWEPDRELLPNGITALSEEMDMPCMCHARYFDAASDYTKKYQFVVEENSVQKSIQKWALIDDPAMWDELMDNCDRWNCFCFEQDWMVTQWDFFEHLRTGFGNANKWLAEMSIAAQVRDLTIQYCMTPSNFLMAAVQFPNISHIRCSRDYHGNMAKNMRFPQLTQVGLLAWALGLIPFSDVQKSSTNPGETEQEKFPLTEAIAATLSCGPVGFGDQVGHQDPDIILQTCRPDGLILKPDYPLRPAPIMFLSHAKHYWTYTESFVGNLTWYYAFAINLWGFGVKEHTITPRDLRVRLETEYLWYGYDSGTFGPLTADTEIGKPLEQDESAYYVLCPKIRPDFAIIGLERKIAMMSAQAIKNILVMEDQVILDVDWPKGTRFSLLVYSNSDGLKLTVLGGKLVEKKALQNDPLVIITVESNARVTSLTFKW